MDEVKELDYLIAQALEEWDGALEAFKQQEGPEPETMVVYIARRISESDWLKQDRAEKWSDGRRSKFFRTKNPYEDG